MGPTITTAKDKITRASSTMPTNIQNKNLQRRNAGGKFTLMKEYYSNILNPSAFAHPA